jgi:acid phosphatase
MRAATVANLKRAGYAGWKGLVLRSLEPRCNVTCFKRMARAAIAAQGYTIIANIGDQWSDLDPAADKKSGSYAERIYKVPNPFYFIR